MICGSTFLPERDVLRCIWVEFYLLWMGVIHGVCFLVYTVNIIIVSVIIHIVICSCFQMYCFIATTVYSPNSTWLVTSRLDTTRHDTSVLFDKFDTAKCIGPTRRTSCVVSRRDATSQVGFGRISSCCVIVYYHLPNKYFQFIYQILEGL